MSVASEVPKPRILIVEDSYLTAEAVCDLVEKCGCEVAAAVGRVETGVEFLRMNDVDGAVVDIDLHGTASFPICDQLRKRDIPFVLLTGYDESYAIPPEFRSAPRLSKPVDGRTFENILAGFASAGSATEVERGNQILEGLSPVGWRRLRPRLERVAMVAEEILETPGGDIRYLYFPVTGLVSLRACSPQGKRIEVGLIGREGATGLAVLLGRARGVETEAVVQHAGLAWRLPARVARELHVTHRDLHAHLLGAVHVLVGQMARNLLAIGYGTIEQRLARRLLMTSVRLQTKRLALTHDGLSRMLGVRRSGVTVALHMLESRRVIRARRNLVEILDHEALVREAGENCWGPADLRFASDD